ncbi:hypothetical protein L2E82_50199 [Cichorium intybus]|nr:hypothetical protein L2E82_50199 [Cichorium intybus]
MIGNWGYGKRGGKEYVGYIVRSQLCPVTPTNTVIFLHKKLERHHPFGLFSLWFLCCLCICPCLAPFFKIKPTQLPALKTR